MLNHRLFPRASSHVRAPWLAAVVAVLGTALALLAGVLAQRPLPGIAVGGGADDRALVLFGLPERNATDAFRWTYPLARVFLYGLDGRPALLDMRVASPRPDGAPPATLAPVVQGVQFGPFAVSDRFRRYRLLVPSSATRETVLDLQGSVFHPGGGDPRELGVAISRVNAVALGSPLLAWPRLVTLLAMPLIGWLLAWRLGMAGWAQTAVGAALVLLAGVAALFPARAGYWLPLLWWPAWPIVPLLLLAVAPSVLRAVRARGPVAAWLGLGVAVAGLLLVRGSGAAWLGMALAFAGTLAALAGLSRPADHALGEPFVPHERLALALLCAVALALRLYHLDTLPVGLWRDEARHGLAALRIWNDPTYRPVYVVDRADLPALLFYLMAPVIGLFGPHVWSERLISAVAGGLTPLALWWAVRPLFGGRTALLGAALLAGASWSLSMSRWGFPATLDQLFTLAALGAMLRALDYGLAEPFARWRRAWLLGGMAAAGLCAGLAAYTYHTGRFTPLIVALLALFRLGVVRSRWRRALPGLALGLLVCALVLLPLLRFIARNYDGYSRRVDLVALLNSDDLELRSPASLLLRNAGTYLLMWQVKGEWNGRHHAPDAPMLDPLAGALLLLGAGLALRFWRDRRLLAVAAWLALALLPGIFSTDAPHAMRSLPALAPALILAAVGFDALLRAGAGATRRRLGGALLAGGLAGSLLFNGWLYFVSMPRNPRVYNEFEPPLTAMARVANESFRGSDPAVRGVKVFLDADVLQEDVVRFLDYNLPVGLFDGVRLVGPAGAAPLLLLPPDASPDLQQHALQALGPGAHQLAHVPLDPGGAPLFLAYSVGNTGEQVIRAALPGLRWGEVEDGR